MTISTEQKNTVQIRIMKGHAIPTLFAEQRVLIDALGVLFWPKYNVLIFSDLHFEKASYLSQFANPLPLIDTADTLQKMQRCLALYRPSKVVCLGDSLHDEEAVGRMSEIDLNTLNNLVESTPDWYWVLGNHDPAIPKIIKGKRVASLLIDCVLLVHEPENLDPIADANAQIIGHFHPKTRHKIARQQVRGKCFLKDNTHLLMPAFGSYTGGLDSEHEALTSMLSPNRECYLMFKGSLFKI